MENYCILYFHTSSRGTGQKHSAESHLHVETTISTQVSWIALASTLATDSLHFVSTQPSGVHPHCVKRNSLI